MLLFPQKISSNLLELRMALISDEQECYEMKTSAKKGVSSTSRVFLSVAGIYQKSKTKGRKGDGNKITFA